MTDFNSKYKQPLKHPAIRTAAAVFCCFLWGSAFPCIKIGYDWFNIITTGQQILFAGIRFTLAGIVLLAVGSISRRKLLKIPEGMFPAIFGIGFVQTTLEYLFFYIGLAHITGSKSSIIDSTATFVSIIMAHFLIKGEKINRNKIIGCFFGLAGVILVNLGGITAGFSFMGEGMIFMCAAAYGAGAVLIKMVSHKVDPVTLTSYQLMFGGLVLTIAGLLCGARISVISLPNILLMTYMVFISAAAFGLWTALLKYNSVSSITIFNFAIPVFGVILSWIFAGENIASANLFVSLILVSIGIITVNRSE